MDISIVVDDEDAPVRLIVWGGVHNFSRLFVTAVEWSFANPLT
jgi:hypothetical protein